MESKDQEPGPGRDHTCRAAPKRSLSRELSPETSAKKIRPFNTQTCRESTDEDDIKVLKSDFTRNLDDKDSDQSNKSSTEETDPGASEDRDQRHGNYHNIKNIESGAAKSPRMEEETV